jgi:hypothetical protein
MSQDTLDRLCKEALQRINYWINRSAGQHVRAMKNNWSKYRERKN